MTHKIEPFRGHFENFQAMLARIAEDSEAVGMAACIKYKDGSMKPVNFEVTYAEIALAGAVMLQKAIET